MSPFRPSRESVGPDPHLDLKMLLFAIGAAFGVAGMVTGLNWLLYIGIAILMAGVLLRLGRPSPEREPEPEPGELAGYDDVAGEYGGVDEEDEHAGGSREDDGAGQDDDLTRPQDETPRDN